MLSASRDRIARSHNVKHADRQPMQQLLRFSTDALPERDRLAIFCEELGRRVVSVQMDPVQRDALSATAILRNLPGLSLASMDVNVGFRVARTRQLIGDGKDDLILNILIAGTGQYRQINRESELASQEGVLLSAADEGIYLFPHAAQQLVISVPRGSIASLVKDPESAICRRLPRTAVWPLLASYVQSADPLSLESPDLARAFATHVQDLIALAVGATRDGVEVAQERGLRAARLRAIKGDISEHFGSNELSINALARRHGVSPRYIHKLFETEGATFTAYVMERRLLEARRMLSDRRFADCTITEVAGNVGFGDLSYFTRSFRRRFGMTPTDARELARRENGTAP
ncbi:AraC-like DNA-binding protein [Nitrobacteraceae bacterium AZCC 1564]